MNSFEDIDIENLHCQKDNSSGLSTKLYYAPASYFFFVPLPQKSNYETAVSVSDEILMKPEKKLKHIDVLIDESEIKVVLTGGALRKKIKTTLSFFILGLRASVLGFIDRCASEKLIFFIKDIDGNVWQIGNLINAAFFESAEASSGKKYEDNSGVAVTITANCNIVLYKNSIDEIAVPGDFNSDFNNDFLKTTYD